MKKRYTIESPGEEPQVVGDLAGCDGWTVVGEEEGKSPADLHVDDVFDPVAGVWKRSAEKKREREARAALRDPDALDARLKALEARIAELERLAAPGG